MDVLYNLKDLLNPRTFLNQTPEIDTRDGAININAGGKLLCHFQKQWEEMHETNEQNAMEAERISHEITDVHKSISQRNNDLQKINQMLTNVPNIKNNIIGCTKQLTELYNSFEKIELALVKLEDIVERCELEQQKSDHLHQFALYKEKKFGNLESVRSDLANRHTQNLIDYEIKRKKTLQERQLVFQEAFKNDLETFKALGSIPKIEVQKTQPSALLEEIQLDIDDKELNEFLNDK